MRRATLSGLVGAPLAQDFYPRSPCGERRGKAMGQLAAQLFLSTLSLRRATTQFVFNSWAVWVFLSTLSLRRATFVGKPADKIQNISIHALLAESDLTRTTATFGCRIFLSTLSLRRATEIPFLIPSKVENFYPRSPCGERPS